MILTRAAELSSSSLTALWNAAYEGYFVPLRFDEAMVARHVRRSQIDLSRSLVGSIEGEPFGLSLAGFRDAKAWIGGFGVAPAFRRRGLATRLLQAHLGRIDDEGLAETWLEVIEANPAREVYRRCGFDETRELLLFEGTPPVGEAGGEGETLTLDELGKAHAELNTARPSWRRDWPTVADCIAEGAVPLGIRREGRICAYALVLEHGGRLTFLDAAARDSTVGALLLTAIGRRWPAAPARLVDEPTDTALAEALRSAGLAVGLRQVEMRRSPP